MNDKLAMVLAALNNRDIDGAAAICSEWRNEEPASALACNLSGVVAMEADDINGAVSWFEAATQLDSGYAKAWCNLGVACKQVSREIDALACLKKAAELAPTEADIKYNLALLMHEQAMNEEAKKVLETWPEAIPISAQARWLQAKVMYGLGRLHEACAIMAEMTKLYKDRNDLWLTYGDLLREAGQVLAAEIAYREAVKLNKNDFASLRELGNLLLKRDQLNDGMQFLKRAFELQPDDYDALLDYAHSLFMGGIFLDARQLLQRALEKWPNDANVHYRLGLVEGEHGDSEFSEKLMKRAIEIDPAMYMAQNYLGVLLLKKWRIEEAAEYIRAALSTKIDFAESYNSLGNVYWQSLSIDNAEANYRKAIELKPEYPEAHHNLGLLLLLTGRFDEGWQHYEWRQRIPEAKIHTREFDQPAWRGEDLASKRIFVHQEQGFGDVIQFVRYVPLLAQQGAEVIFESPPQLSRLLASVEGISCLVQRGNPSPEFDYYVPLLNVPRFMGTRSDNIPCRIPYLKPDPSDIEKWGKRLDTIGPGYRVGIVWAGNPKHLNDRCRSMNISELAPLASIENVKWISLYRRPKGAVISEDTISMQLIDWTEELSDYTDTAALIAHLDLVISVDTSVAHLAGALGKPVWIMIPFVPDWRWMLDRSTSPWYPTATLYRQKCAGDWADVMENILKDLTMYIKLGASKSAHLIIKFKNNQ
jgi:tetratricopeptide (TPR) repeat protein